MSVEIDLSLRNPVFQGDLPEARQAWEQGLEAARAHGDRQAEKEMAVFLKKLDRPR